MRNLFFLFFFIFSAQVYAQSEQRELHCTVVHFLDRLNSNLQTDSSTLSPTLTFTIDSLTGEINQGEYTLTRRDSRGKSEFEFEMYNVKDVAYAKGRFVFKHRKLQQVSFRWSSSVHDQSKEFTYFYDRKNPEISMYTKGQEIMSYPFSTSLFDEHLHKVLQSLDQYYYRS